MSHRSLLKRKQLQSWDFRLKLTEMSLVSLCFGLGLDTFMNGNVPQWPGVGISCILTGAYVIITSVTIGCCLLSQPLPRPVGVAFSLVGGVLLATAAVFVLRAWRAASAAPPPAAVAAGEPGRASWLTGLRQMRMLGMLGLGAAGAYAIDAAYAAVIGPWLQEEQEAAARATAAACIMTRGAVAAATAAASTSSAAETRDADGVPEREELGPLRSARPVRSPRLPQLSARCDSAASSLSMRPPQTAFRHPSAASTASSRLCGWDTATCGDTQFGSRFSGQNTTLDPLGRRLSSAYDRMMKSNPTEQMENWKSSYMRYPQIDERESKLYKTDLY